MIEVHLLRYMLAAADTGSFSRAAEQFGIKQSTLSKHVLNLELRMGLRLFERSTRGVAPTELGQRFLTKASQILADIESLREESRALATGAAGRLRLGFQGSLTTGDLAAVLRAYRFAWPDVEIRALEQSRSALLRAIERDQLDLAICGGEFGADGIASQCFWREPIVIGLAANHPLADRDRVYWTDLRCDTFVIMARGPGPDLADLILSRLSGAGRRPRIVPQDVGRDNLSAFATGNQVTVSAGESRRTPSCHAASVPAHDAFGPTMIEQAIHWRRENPNPALRRFFDLLAERYARPPAFA